MYKDRSYLGSKLPQGEINIVVLGYGTKQK